MILIIWKHVRESLTHNKFRCTTTMNHNITYLIAGGASYFPYILLNESQTMFSQLAKRSERAFPADLCTDHAHYVKHRSSMVLRRNKNMVVQGGQFLAIIFWKCANLLILCRFTDIVCFCLFLLNKNISLRSIQLIRTAEELSYRAVFCYKPQQS